MDYDAVFDAIAEAARDVLSPLIDDQTLDASNNDVRDLAERIASRAWELLAPEED